MDANMAKTRDIKTDMGEDVEAIIEAAYVVSEDLGTEVRESLKDGLERPLDEADLRKLLTRIVTALKVRAAKKGSKTTLDGTIEEVVEQVMRARTDGAVKKAKKRVALTARLGIPCGKVFPRPMFHEKEIPMNNGWVKTTDINLWPDNERLEIHVAQFHQQHGRKPNSEELLKIMMTSSRSSI
jgi:hypothetical protein